MNIQLDSTKRSYPRTTNAFESAALHIYYDILFCSVGTDYEITPNDRSGKFLSKAMIVLRWTAQGAPSEGLRF